MRVRLRTTADAYQPTPAENGDGFVAKLTKDGTALDYATYIGGVDYDYASDLVVDSRGNAWANVVTWITVNAAVTHGIDSSSSIRAARASWLRVTGERCP